MEACITPYDHKTKGSGLVPWSARLTSPPPRLADFGYSANMFQKDIETWRQRVDAYWDLLSSKITPDLSTTQHERSGLRYKSDHRVQITFFSIEFITRRPICNTNTNTYHFLKSTYT